MGHSPYLRNAWYAAAWSDEIGHALTQHWLLEEPIALYRTEAGTVAALGDRCPHRRYSLSKGVLAGDNVQCGYHGFTFDPSGACVAIPSQEHIPGTVWARCYLAVERWGIAWLWMGDPATAEPATIPDCHWIEDPAWHTVRGTLHVSCGFGLMNDNLLDLSHLAFVHADTIGAGYIAKALAQCEVDGVVVRVKRTMEDVELPPLHARTMGLKGPVDRWQVEEYFPPSFHLVSSGSRSRIDHKTAESRVINALTPHTRATTTYLWAMSYSYPIEPVTMRAAQLHLLNQDKAVVEAQQVMIDTDRPDALEYNAMADAGVVQGRRVLAELIRAEG